MPFDNLRFDLALPDDAETLHGWVRDYYSEDGLTFDSAAVSSALRRLLADPTLGRAFFLKLGSVKPAGYFVFTFGFDHEFGGSIATVTDLFIAPGRRGLGLGTAALSFIAATCRTLGVCALELQVETHNAAGQALYRKFGFKPLPRLPMHLSLDSLPGAP